MRCLLYILIFLTGCLAAPFTSLKEIPEQYRGMVPKEAVDFLSGLTEVDKRTLQDWAKGHAGYRNEHEALQALKLRSPGLGEKAEKLHNFIKDKVNGLSPEAKAFASEIIDRLRRLQAQIVAGEKPSLDDLKKRAALAYKKYTELSAAAKSDLEQKFPLMMAIMKNEKFTKMAESYTGPLN